MSKCELPWIEFDISEGAPNAPMKRASDVEMAESR